MKKRLFTLFLFLFLILNLLSISLINAQEAPPIPNPQVPGDEVNPDTGLPASAEKVGEIGEKLSDEEERSAYLKQEWEKILAKNEYFKPVMAFYGKISPVINPISKYITGMIPSLSWLYFLTLIMWITFAVVVYRLAKAISQTSKLLKFAIFIPVMFFISIYSFAGKISGYIVDKMSILKIWWIQLIAVAVVILALFLLIYLSKAIDDISKSIKEKREKEEEEINREKFKRDLRVADKLAEGMSNI